MTPDKIEITEEMRLELDNEMSRTGVGKEMLFTKSGKPDGVTASIIGTWRTGDVKTADPNLFNLVLKTCKYLPDAKEKIVITEEMRQELDKEMTRTASGSAKLYSKMGRPEGLSHQIIDSWRVGTAKVADPDLWILVLKTYNALPDAKAKIEISENMRRELGQQMKRSGLKAETLFERMGRPEKLTAYILAGWRCGATKSADPDLWTLAINTCKSMPDAKKRIDITEKMRLELDDEMNRSGIGNKAIYKKIGTPEGLSPGMIESWRRGTVKSAEPHLFTLVLDTYKALPTKSTNSSDLVSNCRNNIYY